MKTIINNIDVSLTIIIVNYGMASKVLKEAKKRGVTGGTILMGKGIGGSVVSKILGMDESRKEIILMIMRKEIEKGIHKFITEKFSLKKKNKGILFSINTNMIKGVKLDGRESVKGKEGKMKIEREDGKYEAIFVVVNRGEAKKVVNTAVKNGATGGTILHGRGAGIYENSSIFSMTIEPEKEIIFFLVKKEKVEMIIDVVEKTMKIEEPGKGIIFTVPVNNTEGLYEEN